MAPMGPDEARSEQIRLAKELQRDFQKSGTFKTSYSGRGRGRSPSRTSTPNKQLASNNKVAHHPRPFQAPRQQLHNPSSYQPPNPNKGRTPDNRKRKMDSQTADFFADRANTAQERGPVHYYQGQDRAEAPALAPTASPAVAASPTAMGASQGAAGLTSPAIAKTATQTAGFDQTNAGLLNTPASFPSQAAIPSGPIVWLYQDNNEQPQPLARDETVVDMDMPDASTAGVLSERARNQLLVCSCTRVAPLAGRGGLGGSRWSANNTKVDDNCPYHGTRAVSSFLRNDNGKQGNDGGAASTNSSGGARSSSENLPKRFVGYYQ